MLAAAACMSGMLRWARPKQGEGARVRKALEATGLRSAMQPHRDWVRRPGVRLGCSVSLRGLWLLQGPGLSLRLQHAPKADHAARAILLLDVM